MEVRGNRTLQVAGVALQGVVDTGVDGIDVGIIKTEAETTAVRWAADVAGLKSPLIVAVIAEPAFMATRAEVLIGACRNRMADLEIVTMHVDHVIA